MLVVHLRGTHLFQDTRTNSKQHPFRYRAAQQTKPNILFASMVPNAMFQRLYGCDKNASEKTLSGSFRVMQGPLIYLPGRPTIIGNRSLTFTPHIPPHPSKRPCIMRLPTKFCRFDARHSPTATPHAARVDQHAYNSYKNDKSCRSKPVESHVTSCASLLGIQPETLRSLLRETRFEGSSIERLGHQSTF